MLPAQVYSNTPDQILPKRRQGGCPGAIRYREDVQIDVGKQGRNDPTLRGPLFTPLVLLFTILTLLPSDKHLIRLHTGPHL